MVKQTKVCRVCGKTYEACNSIKTGSSVFNWREVACSPECGEIYLRQVMAARSPAKDTETDAQERQASRSRKKKSTQSDEDATPGDVSELNQ